MDHVSAFWSALSSMSTTLVLEIGKLGCLAALIDCQPSKDDQNDVSEPESLETFPFHKPRSPMDVVTSVLLLTVL